MSLSRNTFFWIGVSTVIGFLSLGTTFVTALESHPDISEESLSITAGDMFEILAVSDIRLPEYSWIRTRNRQFLQAGQTPTFRNRFLEPGIYTLNIQIRGGIGAILSHTISISVIPRSKTYQEEPADITLDQEVLVRTTPFKNTDDRIILNDNKKTLLLKPFRVSLALDLFPSIDTNGDGIPQNDQDTRDTFFQEEGTPLFLWLASSLTEKTLVIHDTLDPRITPQMIHVVSLKHAESKNMLTGEIQVIYSMQDDGSSAFSIAFEGDTPPDIPLLYEWNFDDGEKSLVNAPVHTFVKSGTYNVNVHLRNLNSNETVAIAQVPITISTDAPVPESIPPPIPTQEPESSPSKGLRSYLSMISIAGGIIFGLVILVTGIFFILKKIKRGRSTETIVARLEEKVVKEKDEDEPRPFVVVEQKDPTQEKGFPIDDEKVTASEESAVPAWLKKEEQKQLEVTDSTSLRSLTDAANSQSLTDAAVVPPWLSGIPKPSSATLPTTPPPVSKLVVPPTPAVPTPIAPPPSPPTKSITPILSPPPSPLIPITTQSPKSPPAPSSPKPAAPSPPSPVVRPPDDYRARKPAEPPKPASSPKPVPPPLPKPSPKPAESPAKVIKPAEPKDTNEPPIAFVHVDSIQPSALAKSTEVSPSQKKTESQTPQAKPVPIKIEGVDKPKPAVGPERTFPLPPEERK